MSPRALEIWLLIPANLCSHFNSSSSHGRPSTGRLLSEDVQSLLDAKDQEIEDLKRQNTILKDQLELAKLRNLLQENQLSSLMMSDSAKRRR